MMCEALGVTPHECVYLDDLGGNLKPATRDGHDDDQRRKRPASDRGAARQRLG